MATLHAICGKPGSGKTTLARELGASVPGLVFIEDAWIAKLGFEIRSVEDYARTTLKLREVIGPLAVDALRLGTSVVFDFGANTVRGRAWLRTIFEAAGADHVLHVIQASDAECLRNIHRRNVERPSGAYFGDVSDALFHAVAAHFVPPGVEEGFKLAPRSPFRTGQ